MIDNKGYRKNVGIVLMNNKNQFLIFKRIGADAWQFPQGGIDKNERFPLFVCIALPDKFVSKNAILRSPKLLHVSQ